jgi:hypothetical protein
MLPQNDDICLFPLAMVRAIDVMHRLSLAITPTEIAYYSTLGMFAGFPFMLGFKIPHCSNKVTLIWHQIYLGVITFSCFNTKIDLTPR